MSLRYRIALTIFLLEAALIGVVLFITIGHTLRTTQAQFEQSDTLTTDLLNDLARLALLTDEFADFQDFIEQPSTKARLDSLALIDLSGRIVSAIDPTWIGELYSPRALGDWRRAQVFELGDYGTSIGKMVVIFNDHDLIESHNEAYKLGYSIALAGMALIAIVGLVMGHVLTRRLSWLTEVADRVADGDTEIRTGFSGTEEIARVGAAIDSMLDRLELQLQEAVRSRDLLLLPTEAMNDGFAIWSAADRLLLCNRRFRELHDGVPIAVEPGIAFNDFLRMTSDRIADTRNMDVKAWIRCWVDRRRAGDAVFELALTDGRWMRVGEWRMADGGTVSIYSDITEVKTRENALLESEERLRVIMDNAGEVIITLNESGQIQTFNRMLPILFEEAPERLVGSSLDDLLAWPNLEKRTTRPPRLNMLKELQGQGPLELIGKRKSGDLVVELKIESVFWRGEIIFIAILRNVTEEKKARATIAYQATHDMLTGLPNRAMLEEKLAETIEHANRTKRSFAVAFVDIDRFKSVNDTFGHAAGDALLVESARRFRVFVRTTDIVARMAGDEFVIILTNLRCTADMAETLRKLLHCFDEPFTLQGRQFHVSISIGAAAYPTDATDASTLLDSRRHCALPGKSSRSQPSRVV